MTDLSVGQAIVEMGLRGYKARRAQERALQQRARFPLQLAHAYPGLAYAYIGDHLMTVERCEDGWRLFGTAPDGEYDYVLGDFKTCRSILGGMRIQNKEKEEGQKS